VTSIPAALHQLAVDDPGAPALTDIHGTVTRASSTRPPSPPRTGTATSVSESVTS